MSSLEGLIAREHRDWDRPVVDEAIFGTIDPAVIASMVDAWCRAELGSGVAGARFYRVSVGCVAAVELEDGRAVVVKAMQPGRDAAFYSACAAVRTHLSDRGFPCPRPLGAPRALGRGLATAEVFEDIGTRADAHEPAIRKAIAAALARLVDLARPFATEPAFGPAWFTAIPEGRAFPKPHSPFFDFEATRSGAEWIEEIALEARARRAEARGDRVVGHFDWRVEHLRFEGDRVVTSYDWDSLHAELETVLVGSIAHAFTADWQREDVVRVPSREEMRAFVEDYETARGRAFAPAERATVAASCVYACAYTARCNHATSTDHGWNGDFRPLVRAHARDILDRGL